MSFANPKGIASFSPRLARQRLPWVRVWNRKQRQRRCGPQPNVAATPLRWVTNQTNRTTSTRLWPFVREWESPQPRLRLEMFVERWPRVARSAQPWALGRNPVGILRTRSSRIVRLKVRELEISEVIEEHTLRVTVFCALHLRWIVIPTSAPPANGAAAQSPRLARTRLPWVNVVKRKQPQRGCGQRHMMARTILATTALRLRYLLDDDPA